MLSVNLALLAIVPALRPDFPQGALIVGALLRRGGVKVGLAAVRALGGLVVGGECVAAVLAIEDHGNISFRE